MAQKKLELNRGLRSVSGIVGAITGRASDEQDSPPLDRPEPPPDSAESAPAEVASELQPLERLTFGRTTNHHRSKERRCLEGSYHETLFDRSPPARRRHPR